MRRRRVKTQGKYAHIGRLASARTKATAVRALVGQGFTNKAEIARR
jgi:hypothetical protein